MSIAALQTLIAPLVAPGVLIFADQNGPRPEKPFATLSVRGTPSPAYAYEAKPDIDGIAEISQHAEYTVEVQCFGNGAFNLARMVGLKLLFPSNVMRAELLGLGVSRIINVSRVPELLNQSQYEERGVLEFTVYDALVSSDDVGRIESVEIGCFDHSHIIP